MEIKRKDIRRIKELIGCNPDACGYVAEDNEEDESPLQNIAAFTLDNWHSVPEKIKFEYEGMAYVAYVPPQK